MPVQLTCPRGHQWQALSSPDPEVGELNCPECGATVRLVPGGQDEATQVTRHRPPAAGREGEATLAVAAAPPAAVTLPSVPGYEVLGVLGRGGMGVVYKARQTSLGRLVALKMILTAEHAAPEEVARFRREAEAVAHLQHPNIVQIHEVGEHAGRPFFSLEFIEGGNLAARLQRLPQPPRQAAELVERLARAMHAAHVQGIIHRDLKPQNVLLARSDSRHGVPLGGQPAEVGYYEPKITDFGLAKFLNREESLTATGEIVGTLSYMAPEQAWGKSKVKIISPAADVYALGAILYEILTGRPPFQGESLQDTLEQVWSNDPVPPRRLQPRVPPDLETICLKALAKDPARRYPSAEALADDLRRLQNGEPIVARPVGALTHLWKWAWRNPTKAVALAAGLLIVLGAFLWLRSEQLRLDAEEKAQRQVEQQAERRRARVLQDVSGVQGSVKAMLDAGRFQLAEQTLRPALERLRDEPLPAGLRSKLQTLDQKLRRLVQFYRYDDLAWFRAGQENTQGARSASETALRHLGILDAAGRFRERAWWKHLPEDVLPREQQARLRQDVYRQLLILSFLRASPALASLLGGRNPESARACLSALETVAQAQALEKAEHVRPAQSVQLVQKILLDILRLTGGRGAVPPGVREPKVPPGVMEPTNPTDYFFSGCIHYFLARAMKQNPLLRFVIKSWSKHLDFDHPLVTAEKHLLEAVRQDPRQFWAHFVLGRTLELREQYRGAQQAFTTCVALREDYPVSYQHRGLAIYQDALATAPRNGPQRQAVLQRARERALQDFRLADRWGGSDPVLYWAKGKLHALLKEDRQALEAYARGLEGEDQLQQMVSRRNVLGEIERYLKELKGRQPNNPDAHAVQALIDLSRGDDAAADAAAQKALQCQSDHARAVAVRGTVHLRRGVQARDADRTSVEFSRALALFSKALNKDPANHLAAAGRAQVYEEQGKFQKALRAFNYLLSRRGPSQSLVAVTPGQQVQAHRGRSRVLEKLGRHQEAARARQEADRLDPAAVDRQRPR
jgi:tetratricopeptide (TPR) repeat protein/tRNA A-37 threonylcarbamoyl transferase component Bud32